MFICCFTSTEHYVTGSPGRPPRLSHSPWALRAGKTEVDDLGLNVLRCRADIVSQVTTDEARKRFEFSVVLRPQKPSGLSVRDGQEPLRAATATLARFLSCGGTSRSSQCAVPSWVRVRRDGYSKRLRHSVMVIFTGHRFLFVYIWKSNGFMLCTNATQPQLSLWYTAAHFLSVAERASQSVSVSVLAVNGSEDGCYMAVTSDVPHWEECPDSYIICLLLLLMKWQLWNWNQKCFKTWCLLMM